MDETNHMCTLKLIKTVRLHLFAEFNLKEKTIRDPSTDGPAPRLPQADCVVEGAGPARRFSFDRITQITKRCSRDKIQETKK